MRRTKHAAILLAMAAVMGWSGGSTDAQASRTADIARTASPVPAVRQASVETARTQGPQSESEWRFVAVRR
ncbi:MAG: hypothetical protein AAGA54_10930 [Myxococcota bacterium]